jgi:hypothetical protein
VMPSFVAAFTSSPKRSTSKSSAAVISSELYGSKKEYLRKFEARLNELERAGWSLPVYHDTIIADVAKTEF